MAERLIQTQTLSAIADAIRAKNGSSNTYTPAQMAAAILALAPGGGESVWFEDRNDDVLDYLEASEVYTESNRNTTSVIGNYASTSIQDQDCPKPFLGTYNLAPGAANTVGDWTVTTMGKPPRMIKLDGGWNVRDCGGWNADGGKVRFGLLIRGARLESATTDDLALLASEGVKLDLDLRDAGNASGSTRIPGASYYNAALTNAYAQMIQNEASTVAAACITAMQSIVNGNPVYVHCASGADRTGSICGMLEALLGMSAADIDRDYELTCFADVEQLTGHTRIGTWNSFWTALDSGQGSQKMNVVKWLRDNGATTALINSFRRAMINGNPSDVDIPTYRITNSLTNCTSNNSAISVDSGSSYTATITPDSGYAMQLLTVTMGGTDITATAVSGNVISIASVTGAIVITGQADVIASYTNIVRTSEALDSTAVYNGGLGYKNGYYTSVGKESAKAGDCCTGLIPYIITSTEQPTDILYLKGYSGAANAGHTRLSTWTAGKVHKNEYNGFLSSNVPFDVEQLGAGYYKLTPKSGVHHSINGVGYVRFSFAETDGGNIIITKNEEIT